jgi:hypothetical protein
MARASLKVVGDFGAFGQSDNSVHGLGFTSFHGPFLYGKFHQPKNRQPRARSGLGFDRNDKADGLAELAGIFAHKCGSLVGGVAAQDCETKRGLITRMTLSDASLTIHRTV